MEDSLEARTRGTEKSPVWSILNLTKLSIRSCTVMWEDRQETVMPEEGAEEEEEEVGEVVEVGEEVLVVVVVDSLYLS